MSYPNDIDVFNDKLNKNQTGKSYVIEERLSIVGGVYDGPLRHDNINNQTIRVFAGSRFTGEEIKNYSISFPDATPWRRLIKIFTSLSEVYVTYETPGDTVEADDINALQSAVTATQTEVEQYKSSGLIDGGSFTRGV
ncbi:phosphoglucomutase [Paenibacillus sp. FSL L8-0323]|uniref:phosphoglucomutase n=1 Tax=Paenibacillus sp. FSL L8-0323 TaxID=2975330 RepID=UPI00096CC999|nr:phosphoglucomutase [Paenibacillus odorifer]